MWKNSPAQSINSHLHISLCVVDCICLVGGGLVWDTSQRHVTASSLCLIPGSPTSTQILQSQGCFWSVIPLILAEAGLCSLQKHVLIATSICMLLPTILFAPLLSLSSLSDTTKHHIPRKGPREQTRSSKAQEWHIPTLPPTPKKKIGTQIFAWIMKYMAPMKLIFSSL